jgi:hypothetical protein
MRQFHMGLLGAISLGQASLPVKDQVPPSVESRRWDKRT